MDMSLWIGIQSLEVGYLKNDGDGNFASCFPLSDYVLKSSQCFIGNHIYVVGNHFYLKTKVFGSQIRSRFSLHTGIWMRFKNNFNDFDSVFNTC